MTEATNTQPTNETTQTPPPNEAKFTQADIDRIVSERLARQAGAEIRKLLTDLGVETPDALKQFVEDSRKRQEAELSDKQKLERQIESLTKVADGYKAQIETMLALQVTERRNAAIEKAAQAAHAEIPADVITWAEREAAEQLKAVMGDDGKVDEKAAKALVEACRKARPKWFVSTSPGVPSASSGKPPTAADARIQGEVSKLPGYKKPAL